MLEIKDLSLTLNGDRGKAEVLRGINLTLEDGKLYVITGPNGSGKSSLVKTMMGIFQPTTGTISFDGKDITGLGVAERAKLGFGYAFQSPPRFKGLKVQELLNLAGRNTQHERICSLLYDVGLCPQDYLEREVDASLSGGELKRIEIATLLARNLRVAMYDEPEAGIDLWSFGRLTDTFRRLHEKTQTTFVIVSHQERIINLADEIILIADGAVKEQGSQDAIWPLILDDVACSCAIDCTERTGTYAERN